MLKLTPILVADDLEACVAFWVDRLGFEQTTEERRQGRLCSVTLQRDGLAVAYRERESVLREYGLDASHRPSAALLIEVNSIEDTEQRLTGLDLAVPLRQTSYGGAEIAVREPGGNLIIFTAEAGY